MVFREGGDVVFLLGFGIVGDHDGGLGLFAVIVGVVRVVMVRGVLVVLGVAVGVSAVFVTAGRRLGEHEHDGGADGEAGDQAEGVEEIAVHFLGGW